MMLRFVARNERAATLYARPGAVTSAVVLAEWNEAAVAPPHVCDSSIAINEPVRDGCAVVLPDAGLSRSRTGLGNHGGHAVHAERRVAPSLMPSPTTPRTWSTCLSTFSGFAFHDCMNWASCP
jgi:hypothetical protein